MVGTPGYSSQEIREVVQAYHLVPHGFRGAWLAERGISASRIRRWRRMAFEGDLDRNLLMREHEGMTLSSGERSAVARARARDNAAHAAELDRLHARIRELEGANDALGKAIGLLHEMSEREPDPAATTEQPGS